MVSECHDQVEQLNPDLTAVRLKRQYVEKYKNIDAFTILSEGDKGELIVEIAPIVYLDDNDEYAKRFDNFMYGLMLAHLKGSPEVVRAQKQLRDVGISLEHKTSIPQVMSKLPQIQKVNTNEYWAAEDILLFEETRRELRDLIKFLLGPRRRPIITRLTDPVLEEQEGVQLPPAYDFEDYRAKVNRYVEEHGNTLAIHKLTHNIPLSSGDYQELQRVLTQELGSAEDYRREYGDTPFGLLIRRIAKLDHEAAMEAFSAFINDASLNQRQIAFVHKIINHVEQNGYMEDITQLQNPPFDKPVSFIKLFDAKRRLEIMHTIQSITENAKRIVG